MKKLLLPAFIFLISCNKNDSKPVTNPVAVVNYSIQDSDIKITDTTAGSKAIWVLTQISKGYGLQAYNSVAGGEVHDMISIFIASAELKNGYKYAATGNILRNSEDNAAALNLPETYLSITITDQSNNKLSGTFTGHLKNLSTNEYFDVSGDFKNVALIGE